MFLIIAINLNVCSCTKALKAFQKNVNVTAIAQVLHDITVEFLLSEKMRFNILFLKKVSSSILDICDEFLAKLEDKTRYRLTTFEYYVQ